MENKRISNTRIIWLDYVRALAILLISMNHAINRVYSNYNNQYIEYLQLSMGENFFKATITVLSHLGVPLFLMISGALVLSKSFESFDDVKFFYKHNYLSLLFTAEIWYVIMYWGIEFTEGSISITSMPDLLLGMLKTMLFIDQVTFESMWYMSMILALYLVFPLFAYALNHLGYKALILPLTLVCLSTMLIPNINSLFELLGSSYQMDFSLKSANVFSGYTLYLIMGYVIYNVDFPRLKNTAVYYSLFISILLLIAYQLFAYHNKVDYLLDYDFIGILIVSSLLFLSFKRSSALVRISVVEFISKASFGIYFLHIIIMELLNRGIDLSNIFKPVRFLVLESVSVITSCIIIVALKKSSFLKTYLFHYKD